jgi:hypothetical protein
VVAYVTKVIDVADDPMKANKRFAAAAPLGGGGSG